MTEILPTKIFGISIFHHNLLPDTVNLKTFLPSPMPDDTSCIDLNFMLKEGTAVEWVHTTFPHIRNISEYHSHGGRTVSEDYLATELIELPIAQISIMHTKSSVDTIRVTTELPDPHNYLLTQTLLFKVPENSAESYISRAFPGITNIITEES